MTEVVSIYDGQTNAEHGGNYGLEETKKRVDNLLSLNNIPSFINETNIGNFCYSEIKSSCKELGITELFDFILTCFGFDSDGNIIKKDFYKIFDFCNTEIKSSGGSMPISEDDFDKGIFDQKIYISSKINNPKDFLSALSHEIFHSILEIYFVVYQANLVKKSFSNLDTKVLFDQKHEILAYMHGANFNLKNEEIYSNSETFSIAGNGVNTGNQWYDNSALLSVGFISIRNKIFNIFNKEVFDAFCINLNTFLINVENIEHIESLQRMLIEALKTKKFEDFIFYLENGFYSEDLETLYNNIDFQKFKVSLLDKIKTP